MKTVLELYGYEVSQAIQVDFFTKATKGLRVLVPAKMFMDVQKATNNNDFRGLGR